MKIKTLAFTLLIASSVGLSYGAKKPPYLNPSLDIDTRTEDLLSRMTLHEKVLQLQNRQVGEPSEFNSRFEGHSIGTIHDMDHNTRRCREILDSLYG